MKFYYYVIFIGRNKTGIFTDFYSDVYPEVNGYPNAKYYGFNDYEGALNAFEMGLQAYEAMRFRDISNDDLEFRMEW